MKENENAVETDEVASPDEAEMLGAFDEDAVGDDDAAAAASDPAMSATDALAGRLIAPTDQ
ncbi:hypothetical protein PSP6_700028 [Paraburkholderia tropica]|uniref:hypothetical protein n=1 Tax=Paraburkholderia tropica TaxID=92647 RepID=UPI001CAEB6EA|nr:hypothetical protein [Paraburkholderia tropica]CAG9236973.1 hypothetical protein PSP6_700028 [Paraburkholderia tropica]